MTRILLVEDDDSLSRALLDAFAFEGFDVRRAADGAAALQLAAEFRPDVILLDVSLPDADGFALFGPLHARGRSAIIFLTARGQRPDKLRGLGLGADDYVTKPFDLEELLARVRVAVRRSGTNESLVLGEVVVNFARQEATRQGRPLRLSHREFELLRYLSDRRNRVVDRDELLQQVWGYSELPLTRLVDKAVARLRKKIEAQPHHPRFLHTVHGDGYCLTDGGPPHDG